MNILRILTNNFLHKPITLRLPEAVPEPNGYRGPVKINEKNCICCGICGYVCISNAVLVIQHDDGCEWEYHPGRCTFCGKCADSCPGDALSMGVKSAASYSHPEELNEIHRIPYPLCPECGRPTPPVREPMLIRAFKEMTEQIRSRGLLCQRCRLRRAQKDLWATAGRAIPPEGKEPQ
jgi:ferredoxin